MIFTAIAIVTSGLYCLAMGGIFVFIVMGRRAERTHQGHWKKTLGASAVVSTPTDVSQLIRIVPSGTSQTH
jgi:hypothetical protein